MRCQLSPADDGASFVIPQTFIEQMGIQIGDELELFIVDKTLFLRPLSEKERETKLDHVIQGLLKKRGDVYEVLAYGVP